MMEIKEAYIWLVIGVIGKRGEREEQKLYIWGCLLGVKSGHQKTKSSDTCKEEFYQKLKCTKVTTLWRNLFIFLKSPYLDQIRFQQIAKI
jgi:hypothetical protein